MPLLINKQIKNATKLNISEKHLKNIRDLSNYVVSSSIVKLNDQSLIDLVICIPVNIHLRDEQMQHHGKLAIKQFNQFYTEEVIDCVKKHLY